MADRNAVWRRSGSSGGQQQSNRPSSGSNTPRERANTPATGKPSQDGSSHSGRGGSNQGSQRGGRRDNSQGANNVRSPQTQAQTQATSEAHVPVSGYNPSEVKEYMKKSYSQTLADAGGDEKAFLHKPSDAAQPKSAAPWGTRLNHMANGQNFWVELTKQIKALDDPGQKPKAAGEQARKGKQ